ncbi:MAG TPA: 4'-phosphopantetheinyl transferase superfamily protein [Chitinophagaceae bacterium]|nr:4'-phosphopantetheinyl transferase superfamily protein [Chitinophagaceae bacterium]
MPIFFQHVVSESTRLGIWKIEETEAFFRGNVPQHRDVTHPHKRLQHLAGRFLLQFLFPDFPYGLVRIADTRKPYLPGDQYHFSISHCGDYAAAIVSRDHRVGIDIEIPVDKIARIAHKFLSGDEQIRFGEASHRELTRLWSAKESVFKWYGNGGVDFREMIRVDRIHQADQTLEGVFTPTQARLAIHYRDLEHLVLTWVVTEK